MVFGGFIITYNRPQVLLQTLASIFSQTHPTEFIWVIDNSENDQTGQVLAGLSDPRIRYHRMGYNAGPAGAAGVGLKLCVQDGAEWIYWGDDNDPPFRNDCFERLLAIRDVNPFCGVLGAVGHFFDRKKGVIKRVHTRLLEKKRWMKVDYVAGGMSMLVSNEVVKAGILPNADLFFGFEELDFCLKVHRKGYSIIVDCDLFLEARKASNHLDFVQPAYVKKKNLNREYYSLRNLLIISDSLSLSSSRNQLIKKWLVKSIYGFRYGPVYGAKNFKLIMLAFFHFFRGISGKTRNL